LHPRLGGYEPPLLTTASSRIKFWVVLLGQPNQNFDFIV